jgi:glycerol-3-phosphate acyltransferase PlsX
MKIVIDVFGCDYPDEVIDGLAKAVNQTEDVTLIATGDKAYIEQRLKDVQFDRTRLEIIDAPEVITNNDVPINALRQKKNSSLVKALEQLRDNDEVPVMITAGSTGAMFAGAILVLGVNSLNERPTLVTALPTEKGNFVCIADCGANVDCKPNQLVKFGEYASKYMQKMYRKA